LSTATQHAADLTVPVGEATPVEGATPIGTSTIDTPRPRATVSAVIVTYYTGPLLWRCLNAILNEPTIKEVVVVDNGNWAKTIANLVEMAAVDDRLMVVSGHGNVGFAAGCNLGASVATGNEILLLNPDAVIPTGAVQQLRDEGYSRGGDKNWVIGGRLVNADGSEQAGARRGPLTPWTAFVEMTRVDKLAPRHPYFRRFNNHCDALPETTVDMPCISGACMLMPKASFEKIGGMDESYFLHAEDVDFCLRFGTDGGRVLFHPGVDVLHNKSSSRTDRIRVEKWKAQSLNRYFRRHFKDQYPIGFVGLVGGLVWAGWSLRSARILAGRMAAIAGFNKRRGASKTFRALRTVRRLRDR